MNFQNQIDFLPEMFDNVRIPDELDRTLVISSIVKRCGLLSPVYSEPYMMRDAIELWFNSNEWTLKHLINIIKAEYSPIENTDRYDETSREITRDLDKSEKHDDSETVNHNTTDTLKKTGSVTTSSDSETTVDASNTATDSVSPYDTEDWSNSSKREEENGSTASTEGSEHVTHNTTDARTVSGGDTTTRGGSSSGDENENTKETFTQHLHGNIGVTTNQQMIEAELALMEKFHVYDWIAMQIEADLFIVLY